MWQPQTYKFLRYAEYLTSAEWRFKSLEAKEYWGWKCGRCFRDDQPLEVHHMTYVRLGRERIGDLIPLCEDCHAIMHSRRALRPPPAQMRLPLAVN